MFSGNTHAFRHTGCQKACVLPENPASYRVVRTKSYLFNKATPLIKTGLLKEIICKALPLPVDDKSLSEVLHQVGLGKLAARIHDHDRWGDILSSGEKQRIALARLILRRPKWIFLDETTSHLEEQEAIRLLRLVREKLPTSGVIMVTHQPGVWNLADDICDISAVL
ncbi:ATP-binding cassette domain-containing protein [Escherichia coli]|uniref:ATP-binding cassette domain-containing protein n=1 Tax=Escherichia coli TaxID=562 RepID=UPI0028835167|nr:ATP-binding cassette domain-containing protein [Escherichia coli]